MVSTGPLELQDQLAAQESPISLLLPLPLVADNAHPDLVETKVLLAPQVILEAPDPSDVLELPDNQDAVDLRDPVDHLVPQAAQGTPDVKDLLETMDAREARVPQEPRVPLDHLDPKDHLGKLAALETADQEEPLDPRVHLDPLDLLDKLESLADQDNLVVPERMQTTAPAHAALEVSINVADLDDFEIMSSFLGSIVSF